MIEHFRQVQIYEYFPKEPKARFLLLRKKSRPSVISPLLGKCEMQTI